MSVFLFYPFPCVNIIFVFDVSVYLASLSLFGYPMADFVNVVYYLRNEIFSEQPMFSNVFPFSINPF